MELTLLKLKKVMPFASNQDIIDFIYDYNRYRWIHKFENKNEICAYIANVAHESQEFKKKVEIASGKAYEWSKILGNIFAGDGPFFKGRGWLMLTGRWNYTDFTKWYNRLFKEKLDFTTKEGIEKLEQEHELCFISAIYFWRQKNIKTVAQSGDFEAVCEIINGGTNGLADRKKYYNRALKYL